MSGLRIVLGKGRNGQIGDRIARSMRANADIVREAMRQTARNLAEDIETQGRTDIKGAGNFGSRWTDGLQATVTEGGGNIRVSVTMAVTYWTVFQFGAVIHGKPLLWIPLDFASDAKGIRARDYPGKLFRVNRKSGAAPLLMAAGSPAQPKYFGKESVTIPKKFHLLEIVQKLASQIEPAYRRNFKFAKSQKASNG